MGRRLLLAIPVMLFAWIAVLAVVMRLGGEAPGAFVAFPGPDFIGSLPDDVAITSRSVISVTVQSETADLTKRLYAEGALIVLPAGLESCIPQFLMPTLNDA